MGKLGVILFLGVILGCGNSHDFFKDRVIPSSCGGTIVSKYRDKRFHNKAIVELRDYCRGKCDTVEWGDIFVYDGSGLWEYISVGDSVRKASNDSNIFVLRNGVEKVFKLRRRDNLRW